MAKNSWFSCNPKRWIFQNPKWRIFRIADKKFNIWADFPVPFSRIFSFRMRVVSIPEDGMHGARGCMHVLAYQSYHGMQGGLVWHAGQDGEGGAAAAGESAARRLVFPGLMLHESRNQTATYSVKQTGRPYCREARRYGVRSCFRHLKV